MASTAQISDNDLQAVLKYLAHKPLIEVESEAGVNRFYLSQLKRGNYNALKKTHWDKLLSAMCLQIDKPDSPPLFSEWQLALTHNFSIATGTLKRAQDENLCLGLTGTTGFGKTESCLLYRKKNPNVVYVHANTELTKIGFLDAIAQDLQIPHYKRGSQSESIVKLIIANLRKMHHPLLIIDDAGKLKDSVFRLFQILFDMSGGKVGFVLTGVPEFRDKVFRKADKGTFCYKEIARRIGWVQMDAIYKNDIEIICVKNGITDPTAISYFVDNVGDFDTLKRLIKTAKSKLTEGGVIDRTFLATLNSSITNYRVSYVK